MSGHSKWASIKRKKGANDERRGRMFAKLLRAVEVAARARAVVEATTYYQDPDILAKVSRGLGEPMRGLDTSKLANEELLQTRGW